ncbi:ROK family protein [Virgibacillus sp. MSJ-26]|uniref:ROK family protein n=1 Tax=Virgibacillus sp. MSJ-26 TaxID=2841522 RepID=UPI001C0F5FBF|nr:ROK family protein [Virgibacillus sp. MSJ-26]MBU5465397.1 ROK family protein [Virgibacillus sp. MSJ-26]
MKYFIGVDIGGTKVAIAVVSETGKILKQNVIPTELTILPKEMIMKISNSIREILAQTEIVKNDIIGIGIGSPGPLDAKEGLITHPPNLQNWRNVPIVKWMKEWWSVPIILENDANAAALAEKWLGAAQDNQNFVYMTVSTGIGSGIIADGKIYHGASGNAGDIGHTVVDPSFGQCSCGQYGCLESIASGTAIAKRGSDILGKQVTTKDVFTLYDEGHLKIVAFINKVFKVLGVACVSIINTFDPEKIVIGGGVSQVEAPLFEMIRDYVRNYALNPNGRNTTIVKAELDQNAGVIGAAALYLDKISANSKI